MAGNGNVEMMKIRTDDLAQIPSDTFMSSSKAPTSDAQVANRKFVVDREVNGTPTAVFTKYLTGTLDGSGDKIVAHGVTAANILHVAVIAFDNTNNWYQVQASYRLENASVHFVVTYDSTNIALTGGTAFVNQVYRIKIEYIL